MNLYLVTNGLGTYYVVAECPTTAQNRLEKVLGDCDYGFTRDRKVKTIELLTSEISQDSSDKFRMSDDKKFLGQSI
jgi:hypothetical protein